LINNNVSITNKEKEKEHTASLIRTTIC